jgi:NAD+ synthase (glutamine-hydrolysing)
MKICLAQLNFLVGDYKGNAQKIINAIGDAKKSGAELILFPELAVCGYPPRDLLAYPDFIDACEKTINEIALACHDIAAIVGCPSRNPEIRGKNIFNSAFFLEEGKIKHIAHKALLPTYDVFDEYRYFEPYVEFDVIEFKGHRIALTICEDLWDVEEDLMYTVCPMDILAKQKPDIMINIAASPFSFLQAEKRKSVLKKNVEKYRLPLVYVNHVGAQTELIFDGGSLGMNSSGQIVKELEYFREELSYITLEELKSPSTHENRWSKEQLIHEALVLGIRDFFAKLGFKKATLGLSGGIDSALVLALAVEALGSENVIPVLLPSPYSSDHSVSDSIRLCENLECTYKQIPISAAYNTLLETLEPEFRGTPQGIAEENLQARIRGLILMALTNKFGYILLNTSNKSEVAVGYRTLYGDMCGALGVIGDIYKTEVYELCRYINRSKEIIPVNILTKAPSAELRPGQKDSDSLPDYGLLDKVLYNYIEMQKSPESLYEIHDKELVQRIIRLVNINEYKRYQTPPILRVSPKAFGMGRRMPIVGKYFKD